VLGGRLNLSTSKRLLGITFSLMILIGSIFYASSVLQYAQVIPTSGSIIPNRVFFKDDFESGDFSAWSGLTLTSGDNATVAVTLPYSGIYSAEFQTGAAVSGIRRACAYKNIGQSPVIYARGYFYIAEGLPLVDSDDRFAFIQFVGLDGNIISNLQVRRVEGEDRFSILASTGAMQTTTEVYPRNNTWYCLELFTRIHATEGAIKAYINGVERLAMTQINTTTDGNVNTIRFGLANSVNIQHRVVVYSDLAAISTSYIGPEEPQKLEGAWAVIGPKDEIPQMENIFWLFGNQSISYVHLYNYELTTYEIIKNYSGLVTWTNFNNVYNFSAVKLFAKTRPVISHIFDFCYYLYPTLNNSMQTSSLSKVTYTTDWGNFRAGDEPEMHNGTNYLTTVKTSDLAGFASVTTIAKFGTAQSAIFHMEGTKPNAGFYVMDLYATRPNSYEAGNWHLFPAMSEAALIKAGRYSRWMTDGLSWRSLDWINNWMTNFSEANDDIVTMQSIGKTVQGRPINALFIGSGTRYFIADAAIHGDEKAGTHSIIRFAELLIEWYRAYPDWQRKLTQYKIILVPVLNPDGYVNNTRDNANGKDLNRQFPPGATTTEPEVWALRWLMGNYTPTQYVTFHSGGDVYPLHVFYAGSSVDPYRTYAKWTVNEGNLRFQDLEHWGTVYNTTWVGKYTYIGPSGYDSMSNEYAYYEHEATSILAEHWGSAKANLHGQEFFITAMLALILHHDRTDGFMLHSNTFITETTYTTTTGLRIYVNATYVAANRTSETKICDFNKRGKPELVYIDGIRKTEGDGWSWNSSANTTTVTGANESIFLDWSAA